MSYLLQRIRRVERRIPQPPNDGVSWVRQLADGRYRIEKPESWNEPDTVCRVPDADFGKVVDDAYLERFAVAIVESDAEPLILRVYHN